MCIPCWISRSLDCVTVAEDDSPYLEVRSAVANTDDPTMPVNTLRVWVIGLLWSIILPGMNQFLLFRFPSITVTGVRRLPRFIGSRLSVPWITGCRTTSFLSRWQALGYVRAAYEDSRF